MWSRSMKGKVAKKLKTLFSVSVLMGFNDFANVHQTVVNSTSMTWHLCVRTSGFATNTAAEELFFSLQPRVCRICDRTCIHPVSTQTSKRDRTCSHAHMNTRKTYALALFDRLHWLAAWATQRNTMSATSWWKHSLSLQDKRLLEGFAAAKNPQHP